MSHLGGTLAPFEGGWAMVIDLILAVWLGFSLQSFTVFLILMVLAALLARADRPFSSGLLKLALMALGISALFSLLGGGDCDL